MCECTRSSNVNDPEEELTDCLTACPGVCLVVVLLGWLFDPGPYARREKSAEYRGPLLSVPCQQTADSMSTNVEQQQQQQKQQ